MTRSGKYRLDALLTPTTPTPAFADRRGVRRLGADAVRRPAHRARQPRRRAGHLAARRAGSRRACRIGIQLLGPDFSEATLLRIGRAYENATAGAAWRQAAASHAGWSGMTFTSAQVLDRLHALADPASVQGMARYGINFQGTLGVSIYKLRPLAREIGVDHALAQELWASGLHEARILASYIDDPALVTDEQMERWVADFDSWDVCDQVVALFEDLRPRTPQDPPVGRA